MSQIPWTLQPVQFDDLVAETWQVVKLKVPCRGDVRSLLVTNITDADAEVSIELFTLEGAAYAAYELTPPDDVVPYTGSAPHGYSVTGSVITGQGGSATIASGSAYPYANCDGSRTQPEYQLWLAINPGTGGEGVATVVVSGMFAPVGIY